MYQDNHPRYMTVVGPSGQGIGPPLPDPKTYHQTVIITTNVVVLGPDPQDMICPSCHAQISTTVITQPNSTTHIFALLLCLFQCWMCCCIPYCIDSCQSQTHYCPNCKAFLGSYKN